MSSATTHPDLEYGTDLLRTVVLAGQAGERRWIRTLGPAAPHLFVHPVPFDDPAPDSTVTLADGTGDRRCRTYRVAGDRPLMAALLTDGPCPEFGPLLRGTGAALRRLHDAPAPAGQASPPRALSRLELWLSGRAPRLWASQAAGRVRDRIGAERWHVLRTWCRDLLDPASGADGDLVPSHGAPGLGSLVMAPDGTRAAMLIGEDRCVVHRDLDIGWLVGELVELSLHDPERADAWQDLLSELVAGYATTVSPGLMRTATLRIALHAHDYSAYVGWERSELDTWSAMLAMLVDRGAPDEVPAPTTGGRSEEHTS